MAKIRNQHQDVLDYIMNNGSITQLEAYREFPAPITRLSAVIFDLKKAGHNIETERISGKNCYGSYSCARYIWKEED